MWRRQIWHVGGTQSLQSPELQNMRHSSCSAALAFAVIECLSRDKAARNRQIQAPRQQQEGGPSPVSVNEQAVEGVSPPAQAQVPSFASPSCEKRSSMRIERARQTGGEADSAHDCR